MSCKWANFLIAEFMLTFALQSKTIDQIGWTNYHWKLFCLTGFGSVTASNTSHSLLGADE